VILMRLRALRYTLVSTLGLLLTNCNIW